MTTPSNSQIPILVVDDDLDDCEMIRDAFKESRLLNSIHFVHNGEEAIQYLHHLGKFEDRFLHPRPGLILLDLNMPRMDGREVLKTIKGDSDLRQIPVVILTTSQAEEDVFRAYNLGVNSFITKPVSFGAFVQVMTELGHYWLQIVQLPTAGPDQK
jgi:CheY-like chemotaxis protein